VARKAWSSIFSKLIYSHISLSIMNFKEWFRGGKTSSQKEFIMNKNGIAQLAAVLGILFTGGSALCAPAEELLRTPEDFHAKVQDDALSGASTLTKDQLLDHLVQAAQDGCRCCGRCSC
jgi:hypothetical protein